MEFVDDDNTTAADDSDNEADLNQDPDLQLPDDEQE